MKTAIVLFNLGGPDKLDAVAPFLRNLFSDPAIIGLPNPLRWLVARSISGRRAPVAREIYEHLGGGSPLLANTEAQARALEAELGAGYKCFVVMRYWHPMSLEQARAVVEWGPDQVLLVPLYPQFSTTTTGSSLADWTASARRAKLSAPTRVLCCYPREPGLVAAIAELLRPALETAGDAPQRVLFTAHGLPKRTVQRGDPYQWQVERTVDRIVERLAMPGLDWTLCYQSRVGPLEWIGPATDQEIERAGQDGVGVVVVPVAFVSEHSETLVELDIEYRALADKVGVPSFRRVATVGTAAAFVAGLAARIRAFETPGKAILSGEGGRLCPAEFGRCPCPAGA